jgi:oxepin-CoA hydrolase/3-oxo-5,6-dehydrosuberyl-CoA semialdehyde dehydrogenase
MTDLLALSGFTGDRWTQWGGGPTLHSAIDSSVVAEMPSSAMDAAAMLHHARTVGGPALRAMTFQERGKLLRALAEAIIARKEELYDLSFATGATRSDGWLDIEGGAGVLFVYAAKARALPEGHVLAEGEREAITKGNFAGQHILTPIRGAAVHINAYNFPVWGMLEKLAPTLLAGVPVIIKPATATAWLTWACFRIMVDSGLLPPGSVQLLLGSVGDMFDHLTGEDAVAFTGSARTATALRTHPVVVREAVRFTAEQDSLNASIMGPDATADSPEFDLFVKEVAREMTVKAGQKCTAIRRALVPEGMIDAAQDALTARLAKVTVGDPRAEGVRMGALAGLAQRAEALDNLSVLKAEAEVVTSSDIEPVGADAETGAFVAPTLLRCDAPTAATLVHETEVFGPAATLMPYGDVEEAGELARRGKGSLALSIFSHQSDVVGRLVAETASSHGRIVIVDRDSAADSTGHGSPMPHLVHGGPGRAGGGEEMGGLIGMKHYMQRTALQAAPATLDAIAEL